MQHGFFGRRICALLLLAAAAGCPANLADNVEHAGPIPGPFAVSDFFTPSGYMGDGDTAGFLLADAGEACLSRPSGARGECYRFRYREDNRCAPFGACRWAGVYWVYPPNNWGSRPGRRIGFSIQRARFAAAAYYPIALPAGGGVGARCASDAACRAGLACAGGACAPAGQAAKDARCLIGAECQPGLQCAAQRCAPAGAGVRGSGCAGGQDELCAAGLRCGETGGGLACVDEGPGDVGAACRSRNDCRSGLFCLEGACTPSTRLGSITFQVGLVPTQAQFQANKDQNVVVYVPGQGGPAALTPDYQSFEIDLGAAGPFDSLLGAFMWAMAFPDGNDVAAAGAPKPYEADPSQPVSLYLDDIVIE